jgi:hypothetical protein
MTSEESPRKKRKCKEEAVDTKEDKVHTKEKEERGPASESSASAVSTQAAASGLSLLSGVSAYNRYIYSQSKWSYRIHSSLYMASSRISANIIFSSPYGYCRFSCPFFSRPSFALALVVAEPGGICVFTTEHVVSTATR